MRAGAIDDEERVRRVLGEIAFYESTMRKVHRTRHVALPEPFGTADIEQHEPRFARPERFVNVPAVRLESEQRFKVCECSRGIRGRYFSDVRAVHHIRHVSLLLLRSVRRGERDFERQE